MIDKILQRDAQKMRLLFRSWTYELMMDVYKRYAKSRKISSIQLEYMLDLYVQFKRYSVNNSSFVDALMRDARTWEITE